MLAAIVPHGSQFWFFKFAGPDDAVTTEGKEFLRFLLSVQFPGGADAPPDWTLPEGWTRKPGNQFRYATIEIDPGPPLLEVSVTTLPRPAGEDSQAAILLNVNRWRHQMGLSAIAESQLGDEAKKITIAGEPSVFVDFAGKLSAGGMGTPPFAGGAMPAGHPELPPDHPALPSDHPVIPSGDSANAEKPPADAPAASTGLTFDTPAGWQPGQLNEMRKAAFAVDDGSQKVEITVVALPAFAGDLMSNVNRWRGQLHLPEATPEDLTKEVKPISIDGAKGSYIELVGPADPAPRQSIIGAMAAVGEQVWFVKLSGDAKLAQREKPKFNAFLKSIKFATK